MDKKPPILEMTIEGDFVTSKQEPRVPFSTRLLIWSVTIAIIAVSVGVAAFALWLLAFMVPVAIVAALVAYTIFRYQIWRAGGSLESTGFRWVRRR